MSQSEMGKKVKQKKFMKGLTVFGSFLVVLFLVYIVLNSDSTYKTHSDSLIEIQKAKKPLLCDMNNQMVIVRTFYLTKIGFVVDTKKDLLFDPMLCEEFIE